MQVERRDQTVALEHGHEPRRRDHATLGMHPAGERLQADYLTGGYVALRLGIEHELALGQRPLDLEEKGVVLFHLLHHVLFVPARELGVVALDRIECHERAVIHGADRQRGVDDGIQAEGGKEGHLLADAAHAVGDLALQLLYQSGPIGHRNAEIVTQKVARHRPVVTFGLRQEPGDFLEEAVARLLSVPLVEQLEMLDVDSHEAIRLVGMRGKQLGSGAEEGDSREQARHRVDGRRGEPHEQGRIVPQFAFDILDKAQGELVLAGTARQRHHELLDPAPSALGLFPAKTISQHAAIGVLRRGVGEAGAQGIQVPELVERRQVIGMNHAAPHILEHAVQNAGTLRRGVLALDMVEAAVGIGREVELEQLVVAGRAGKLERQALVVLVDLMAQEEVARAQTGPFDVGSLDFNPRLDQPVEEERLVSEGRAQGAAGARGGPSAQLAVARAAQLQIGVEVLQHLVEIGNAVLVVDNVNAGPRFADHWLHRPLSPSVAAKPAAAPL